MSLVVLSLPRTSRAGSIFSKILTVHVCQFVISVKHNFPYRPAHPRHSRRGNQLFEQQCCSSVETCFLVEICFPCRPATPPPPKNGNHLLKQNCCSMVSNFCCLRHIVSFADLSTLLIANTRTTCSSKHAVHVLKLVSEVKQCFPCRPVQPHDFK